MIVNGKCKIVNGRWSADILSARGAARSGLRLRHLFGGCLSCALRRTGCPRSDMRVVPPAIFPGPRMLDCSQMSTTKILSQDSLLAERARLRAAGEKLVFTNGVFDILHV